MLCHDIWQSHAMWSPDHDKRQKSMCSTLHGLSRPFCDSPVLLPEIREQTEQTYKRTSAFRPLISPFYFSLCALCACASGGPHRQFGGMPFSLFSVVVGPSFPLFPFSRRFCSCAKWDKLLQNQPRLGIMECLYKYELRYRQVQRTRATNSGCHQNGRD